MLIVSATDLGTPEADWLTDPDLAAAPVVDLDGLLGGCRQVVLVAPHPDDEILGGGGLLRALARRGGPVQIVAVTDGEASHPGSGWTGAHMASRRRTESATARHRLGLDAIAVHHCALPDGRVDRHEQHLADQLAARLDPDTACVAPWRRDGHPDHDAVGRAAVVAATRTGARLIEYPIWAWHWARSATELPVGRVRRLPLDEHDRRAKVHAIAAFISQIHPLGAEPADRVVLPQAVQLRFERPFETFFVGDDGGTMTATGNTGIEYFNRMYEDPDPWGYESSWYEQRKYAITVGSLPRARYRRGFEPGCSIGVLTEALAERCDHLLAADFHGPAAERARRRLQDRPHVTVEQLDVPGSWPTGSFDLIVLSEVAYYLDDAQLALLTERVVASLEPGGEVVLVHWRGETDYPQTGDGVHDRWRGDRRFRRVAEHVEDEFRLDVLRLGDEHGEGHPRNGDPGGDR